MRKKRITSSNTSCLLWEQDAYEENIRAEWIDKVKCEKTYLYDEKSVRQVQINLSIEISQTFIFWAVWANLAMKKSLLVNFALCPLMVVFVKRELLNLSIKHSIFFMSLLFLLSPIYSSLTVSISSDTINNLSGFFMLVRLLFHDYINAHYTAVSLNSGLFAAILLASRLASHNQTVLIILLGLLLFRKTPKNTANFALVLFLFHLAQQSLYSRHCGLQITLHILAQVLLCFIGPYLLTTVFIKHKNNIYGIWDEAEMKLSSGDHST